MELTQTSVRRESIRQSETWPGITELVVNADNEPLLVAGEVGRGRVLAFAGDSTYQCGRRDNNCVTSNFGGKPCCGCSVATHCADGFRLTLDRRRLRRGDEETVAIEWVPGSDASPMPAKIELD